MTRRQCLTSLAIPFPLGSTVHFLLGVDQAVPSSLTADWSGQCSS